jgi:glycogen debranching enzyme
VSAPVGNAGVDPLATNATEVPSVSATDVTLVDGRSFAISDSSGDMHGGVHGFLRDDVRHLSELVLGVAGHRLDLLTGVAATPLSGVFVTRVHGPTGDTTSVLVTRKRWVVDGLREEIHVQNVGSVPTEAEIVLEVGADFADLFDVKAGRPSMATAELTAGEDGWLLTDLRTDASATSIRCIPPPDEHDLRSRTLRWLLHLAPRSTRRICLTVEAVQDGTTGRMPVPCGTDVAETVPMRATDLWRRTAPTVAASDSRLVQAVEQSLADLAALRIVDTAAPERVLVAAGAPWFMTLFGRDSLLTAWMMLPFDASLSRGVLRTLADLQGTRFDPEADEEPGKILHELRRRGTGGPFTDRRRYFGSVDSTPLFVMLAAEAYRWGALTAEDLQALGPAVDAALDWLIGKLDDRGFVAYERQRSTGLANQGWKDSWDGVAFADGALAATPIALVEVQGYAYAALLGAAGLARPMRLRHRPDELRARADRLRVRFNDRFWDPSGFFALGLDGDDRPIDALTTNPGHALWTGIADAGLAGSYLHAAEEHGLWSGWGMRTLAPAMERYDPLSYHNGSVWPHDTALFAAGAARYGHWDIVDRIVDGALETASRFHGRPPELFAGISRDAAAVPVPYPASCAPQAWSSASILLLARTMIGLDVRADGSGVAPTRREPGPDVALRGLWFADTRVDVGLERG